MRETSPIVENQEQNDANQNAVAILSSVIKNKIVFSRERSSKKIDIDDLIVFSEQGRCNITEMGREVARQWIDELLGENDYHYELVVHDIQALLKTVKRKSIEQTGSYVALKQDKRYMLIERLCQSAMSQVRHRVAVLADQHTIGLTKDVRATRLQNGREARPEQKDPRVFYFGLTLGDWEQAARSTRWKSEQFEAKIFEEDVVREMRSLLVGTPKAVPVTEYDNRIYDEAVRRIREIYLEQARLDDEEQLARLEAQESSKLYNYPESNTQEGQFRFTYDLQPSTLDMAVVTERLASEEEKKILDLLGGGDEAARGISGRLLQLSVDLKNRLFPVTLTRRTVGKLVLGGLFAGLLSTAGFVAKATAPFWAGLFATRPAASITIDLGITPTPYEQGQQSDLSQGEESQQLDFDQSVTSNVAEPTIAATQTVEVVEPTVEAHSGTSEQATTSEDSVSSEADNVAEFLFSSVYEAFASARQARVQTMSDQEKAAFYERIGGDENVQNGILSFAFLGLDTGDERENEFGNEGRADQIKVVSIQLATGKIVVTSINRDIRTPGLGGDPINTMTWYETNEQGVLVLREPEVARTVLEQATGVPIDAVFEFNFDSSVAVFDALFPEGLTITLSEDEAFYSEYFQKDFPVGENILHGREMLQFLRERKATSTFVRESNFSKLVPAIILQLAKQVVFANGMNVSENLQMLSDRLVAAVEQSEDPNGANDLRVLWDLRRADGSSFKLSLFLQLYIDGLDQGIDLETVGQLASFFTDSNELGGLSLTTVALSTTPEGGLTGIGQDGKLAIAGSEASSRTMEAAVSYWQLLRDKVAQALGFAVVPDVVSVVPSDTAGSTVVLNNGASIELRQVPVTSMDRHLPIVLSFQNVSGERSFAALQQAVLTLDIQNNPRYQSTQNETWCNVFAWDVSRMLGVEIPHWVNNEEMSANDLFDWFMNPTSGGVQGAGWQEIDQATAQSYASRGIPVFAAARNNSGGNGHIALVRPDEAQRVLFYNVGRQNGIMDRDAAFGELAGTERYFVNQIDAVESE